MNYRHCSTKLALCHYRVKDYHYSTIDSDGQCHTAAADVQIRRVEPEREEQNIGCSGSKAVSEGLDGANERILVDGV